MSAPVKNLRFAFWIVWAAILQGMIVMYFVIAPPSGPGPAAGLWPAALIPFAASSALRWLVVPRIGTIQNCFTAFIIGVALAEASAILGMLVFPEQRLPLFLAGLLGVLQYLPIFVNRYFEDAGPAQ